MPEMSFRHDAIVSCISRKNKTKGGQNRTETVPGLCQVGGDPATSRNQFLIFKFEPLGESSSGNHCDHHCCCYDCCCLYLQQLHDHTTTTTTTRSPLPPRTTTATTTTTTNATTTAMAANSYFLQQQPLLPLLLLLFLRRRQRPLLRLQQEMRSPRPSRTPQLSTAASHTSTVEEQQLLEPHCSTLTDRLWVEDTPLTPRPKAPERDNMFESFSDSFQSPFGTPFLQLVRVSMAAFFFDCGPVRSKMLFEVS